MNRSEAGAQGPRGGAKVRLPPPLVFLGALVVGLLIQRFVWRLSLPLPRILLVAVGAPIALAGLALLRACARLFKRSGQELAPWTPSPTLIVAGPYRWSRNPIYLGMTATAAGIGLALDDLWVALLAGVALAIVHVAVVLPEEAYLAETFGEPYARYRASVRRYL